MRIKSFYEGENTLKIFHSVKASTREIQKVIHSEEKEVFTAAEVATAIKGIKFGKAAGKDKSRH